MKKDVLTVITIFVCIGVLVLGFWLDSTKERRNYERLKKDNEAAQERVDEARREMEQFQQDYDNYKRARDKVDEFY